MKTFDLQIWNFANLSFVLTAMTILKHNFYLLKNDWRILFEP